MTSGDSDDSGEPLPEAPRRRLGTLGVLGLVTLVLGMGFAAWGSRRLGRSPIAKSTATAPSASSRAPRSSGIALTDYSAPTTAVPDAAAAYAAALRNIRSGAAELAGNDFARAAKLDPTLAAAQLRLALYGFDLTPTQIREALAAATRFRSSLDERDQALLAIAEKHDAAPPAHAEAATLAREAATRFARDAEVAYILAVMSTTVDRVDEVRAQLDRALALDPKYATALSLRGQVEYAMKQFDAASAAYDRCLAIAPSASTCLLRRAQLHEARNECSAFEADARRLTQMEPQFPRGHEYLARALASRHAPIESIRAAFDRMVDTGADVSPAYSRSFERYALAMLVGDFPEAMAAARDGDRELAKHTDETVHGTIALSLSVIAIEIGDKAEARRVREDFERRAGAWTQDQPSAIRAGRLVDLHRSGKLSDRDFEAQRDALYREQVALAAPLTGSIDADWYWIHLYLTWPTVNDLNPTELAAAVKLIEAHPPMFDEWGELGFVYVPAKMYGQAIPSLRRSTDRCTIMPESTWLFTPSTLWYLQTNLLLGESLEGTGDKQGACAAYAVVMDQWKNAKPRSVTLEKARARSKALGCGP